LVPEGQIEKVSGGRRVNLMGLKKVASRHVPAGMSARVFKLGVAVAVVIVIAEDDVPRKLKRRVAIDVLEGGLPLWVVRGSNAVFVKIVTDRNDKSSAGCLCSHGHLRGDFGLVGFAISSPVSENYEVERAGGVRRLRKYGAGKETAGDRSLRGYKKCADKIASSLFHVGGCSARVGLASIDQGELSPNFNVRHSS